MTLLETIGSYFEFALAFIVLIGVLVFIHELGHFLAAKWCGIRADVFAVGMGPRLFGWNWKTGFTFGKIPEDLDLDGRTDYRISAFPIGGYVKIAGMIDESMDAEFAARPPEPWEFRSKNTLQKAFVISAGVIMNFLLAIAVLASLNMIRGKSMYDTTVVGFLRPADPAYLAGLREGDRIKSVNGEPLQYFEEVWTQIYVETAGEDVKLDVERNGMPLSIVVPRSTISSDLEKDGQIIPYPSGIYVSLSEISPGSPAEKADLKPGDKVISINGERIFTGGELVKYVKAHPTETHTIEIERNGQILERKVVPGSDGLLGVRPDNGGPVKRVSYGFGQAMVSGFNETVGMTGDIFNMIGGLFSGKAKFGESVAGPVMIAKAAQKSASEGILSFLNLMALLSITLATMNILPIPALDGGHLLFILIEGVIRREVPLKFRMAVQQVGFFLLLALMVFVLYNDTSKLIGN